MKGADDKPRLAPQRDEEEDGGEAVQHLTGLQLTLPSDTHILGAQECSVEDPDTGSGAFLASGSGIRCLFGLWIRDQGWVKSKDPEPG